MKTPQVYINTLEAFVDSGLNGIRLEKGTREDVAALRMAVHLRSYPVDIRMNGKLVYLARTDAKKPTAEDIERTFDE